MVDAAEEYIIIYMPVEVETDGGTPREIMRGLKIEPPPSPKAPPTHPPKNAKIRSNLSYLPSNRISLAIIPLPTLSFKACSFLLI